MPEKYSKSTVALWLLALVFLIAGGYIYFVAKSIVFAAVVLLIALVLFLIPVRVKRISY